MVEAATGSSIAALFRTRGEAFFRHLEVGALGTALGDAPPSVIAVGGGLVEIPKARALLGQSSAHVVYLRASVATLVARQQQAPEGARPASLDLPPDQETQTLLARREGHYQALAGQDIDTDALSPEAVAGLVRVDTLTIPDTQ